MANLNSFSFPNDDCDQFVDDEEYFLGPIVTFKNRNQMEVIDGQQRLTTLMLLLRAFYNKLGSMKDSRSKRMKEDIEKCIWRANEFGEFETSALKINSQVATDEDKEEFIAILKDGQGIGKKSRYAKNFNFFVEKIDAFLSNYPSYFAYFPARVLNNCVLLPIEAESQNTALRIFSTLNDRGKPLSDADIFKAQLYKYYSSFGKKDEFIETWKNLDKITSEVFHPIYGTPLDELFTLFVLSYAPNGMWTYITSVYFMYHRDENDEIEENAFCRFLDCITAFIWAYAITNPGVNSLRTPVYAEMVKIIKGEEVTFSDFKFSEERYRAQITNYVFNNSRAITKSMITWWAFQHDNQSLLSLETRFDIEHIYARNRRDKEKSLSNPQNVEILGNKVLLEKRLNIRASDYRFVDKVKYYKGFTTANGQEKNGSQIVELAEISNSYSDFTETDIINRNSKIIDSFVNFLRVNQLLKE